MAYTENLTGRNTDIDIIKGTSIILMVWGHASGSFKHWIYLFHMAVFFIASGLLWDDMDVMCLKGCKDFLIKKTRSLWIPFILCNGFFNLMHNFFLKTGIYSDNPQFIKIVKGTSNYLQDYRDIHKTFTELFKNFFWAGGSQLGGVTWFLRTLFQVLFIYMVIVYISNKLNIKKPVICISIIVCSVCAAFPVIKNVPFLWIFYTLCGITVPLVLNAMFSKCKNIVLKIAIYRREGRLYKYEAHK